MKLLEHRDFEGLVGTSFHFSKHITEGELVSDMILKRIEVSALTDMDGRRKEAPGIYRAVPFNLYFECQQTDYLPQMSYEVTHPDFAEVFEMFITCLGPLNSGDGFQYESVFG